MFQVKKYSTTIFLVSLALNLLLPGEIISNPTLMLGEEGTYVWSDDGAAIPGIFPLDGGSRLLIQFSARRDADGIRHTYIQIINSDGSLQWEEPLQLSREGHVCATGGAGSDGLKAAGCMPAVLCLWSAGAPDRPRNSTRVGNG